MYDLQLSDVGLTTWALLRQTWAVMEKVAETRLAEIGSTPERIAVLWACREHPGPLIPAEIARFVSRESQSVTGLINRMEAEGLVTRTPKRKGRPFTEIKLTAKGEELSAAGIKVLKNVIAGITSSLKPKDLEQIHEPLRALRQKAVEELHLELTLPPDLSTEETIVVK